jgi:uncharacterized protein (TIGR03435 family)
MIGFLAFTALALAQPAEFEVATIRPSAPPQEIGRTSSRSSTNTDTGQLMFTNIALKDIVRRAYNVQTYQVSGADWLDTTRFDIVARFPPQSTAEQVQGMMRTLLAERFHMAIHRETKDLPVYALTANGPKLKAIEESGNSTSSNSTKTGIHLSAKTTMPGFAGYLSQRLDRPVLDRTGLSGGFEFTLDWSADDSADANGASLGPSIFTAVQEQLGLKLSATKGPVETIVVDRADKLPTEN